MTSVNPAKVLVLSHNAFSASQNNGKTLESFFDGWEQSNLAQIFLQPEDPDWSFCVNYFRITDYEMLERALFRGNSGRALVQTPKEPMPVELQSPVRRLYEARRGGTQRSGVNRFIHNQFINRRPSFVSARELIWAAGRWKSQDLSDWVAEFSPDVLFFQGSSCAFGYQIASWICDNFDVPLVLQLTDDYTARSHPTSVFERINNRRYLEELQKAVNRAACVIAISESMADEYRARFGGQYAILMNSAQRRADLREERSDSHRRRMLYAGNVGLNRWKSLLSIGHALHEISTESGVNAYLDVFAPPTTPEDVVRALTRVPTINYRGFISPRELQSEMASADFLVHVESFDRKMKQVTRLSISTKIPEYLSTGRPIYALGPDEVESIRYLRDNGAAHVTTSRSDSIILRDLQVLLRSRSLGPGYVASADALFEANHTRKQAQQKIAAVIDAAVLRT